MNQNDVIESFKPDFARKHGCAWFVWEDDEHDPNKTGGWASIGGEVAFQFTRVKDLPKDVVWWTNLTKPQAWTLGRWAHFKHGGFLGPEWLTLMSEWGFPHDLEQFKKSCSLWSETLARLSEWLSRFATRSGQDNAPLPHWAWGDGDFCEALAERLSWQQPVSSHHVALSQAYLEQVPQEWPHNALNGKRKLALVLPRRPHAKKVYNARFPKGPFEEVLPAELPQDKDKRWMWVAKATRPLLVRIDEISFKPNQEKTGSLWWGRRGQRFSGSMMEPVWLTGEEALEMCQWIDAYPEAILQGQSWDSMPEVPLWVSMEEDALWDNSIVTGLLSEILWRAAATPVRTATKRIKSGVSPQMIWLRATDKKECFRLAHALQDKGLIVLSYGEGVVNVAFDPKVTLVSDWEDILDKTLIRAPLTIAPSLSVPDGFSSKSVDRWLKKQGSLEEFVMLDRLLVPWLGPQKSLLKGVLEQAMRALANLKAPSTEFATTWKKELKSKTKQAVSALTN